MSRIFRNPWPHDAHRFADILRWKFGLLSSESHAVKDASDEPAEWRGVSPDEIATPPASGWRVTWLGHASFLLQGAGLSLLVDPVFSKHCGPFPMPSLYRKVPVACSIRDLPKIDAVLLTHSHYDHLDLATLRILGFSTRIFVAEGHAAWLEKKGFTAVRELAWYEGIDFSNGVRLTAMPAQHFTARSLIDRDRAHWCGWLLEGEGCKLWHVGDSGHCPAFKEIGERYGPIDFAMIPIGAYQPRKIMRAMHMNPAEAVQVFREARCQRAVAMHWGTFALTDEPLGEPPKFLANELRHQSVSETCFMVGKVGEIWHVEAGVAQRPMIHCAI